MEMRHLRTSPWSGQAAVETASIAIASCLPLRGRRWKGAVEPGAPWEGGLGSNVTTGLGELTYSRKECSPRKEAP